MEKVWFRQLDAPLLSKPLVVEDQVALATTDDLLTVMDQADGEITWAQVPSTGVCGGLGYDQFALMWGGADQLLYRTPLDDFIPKGDADFPFTFEVAPIPDLRTQRTFTAGQGFAACVAGNYADVQWQHDTQEDEIRLCVTRHGVILATPKSLATLESKTGEVLWQQTLQEPLVTLPVASPKHLVAVSEPGTLLSFDKETGEPAPLPGTHDVLPVQPVLLGDWVFFATKQGLHRLELGHPESLELIIQTDAPVTTLAKDEDLQNVVIGTESGSLLFLEPGGEILQIQPTQSSITWIHPGEDTLFLADKKNALTCLVGQP